MIKNDSEESPEVKPKLSLDTDSISAVPDTVVQSQFSLRELTSPREQLVNNDVLATEVALLLAMN